MKRYIIPATVIASVALFVAFGGSSFASSGSAASGPVVGTINAGVGGMAVTSFKAGIPNRLQTAVAKCGGIPTAYRGPKPKAVGGAFDPEGGNPSLFVLAASYPVDQPNPASPIPDEWHIEGYYRDANAHDPPLVLRVSVTCINWILVTP